MHSSHECQRKQKPASETQYVSLTIKVIKKFKISQNLKILQYSNKQKVSFG